MLRNKWHGVFVGPKSCPRSIACRVATSRHEMPSFPVGCLKCAEIVAWLSPSASAA